MRVGAVTMAAAVLAMVLPAAAAGGSAESNRARAQAEAARLLTLVNVPPGTAGSLAEPAGDQGTLGQPTYDEATPNLVDAHAWWTTSASPAAVLAAAGSHLPPGARWSGGGSLSGPPGTVDAVSKTWSLPPVPGVLTERVLGVTAATLPNGVTGVRTDGEAVWLTPRPAWERIPAGVRSVTVTARGTDAGGRLGAVSAPLTLTGGRVRRLAGFVDRLSLVQPGVRSCPAGFEEWVRLRFAGPGGRTLARATEQPTGCAYVALTIGSRRGPPLTDYPSVTDELVRLGAVPVCARSWLAASASPPGPNGPARARMVSFEFANRSDRMCRLAGFPRLTLLDATGRRLNTTVTEQDAASVRHEGLVAASAVLDPGQSAGFGASFTTCRGAPTATRAAVRLPGVGAPFLLAVGSPARPFAPCRGAVQVSNL